MELGRSMFFVVAPFNFCSEVTEVVIVELCAVLLAHNVRDDGYLGSVPIDDFGPVEDSVVPSELHQWFARSCEFLLLAMELVVFIMGNCVSSAIRMEGRAAGHHTILDLVARDEKSSSIALDSLSESPNNGGF